MKKLAVIAAMILALSVLNYGTLAFTTVEEEAVNVVTTGGVDIKLWEHTASGDPFPENGVSGVIPGAVESKIVTVENTGAQPAWVRIRVAVDITLDSAVSGTPNPALVKPNFDTVNWVYRDGFYYYRKALDPGAGTEPLFTQVEFDWNMDNLYQGSTARVKVTAQATQTRNNGSTPLEADGWPA